MRCACKLALDFTRIKPKPGFCMMPLGPPKRVAFHTLAHVEVAQIVCAQW